MKPIDQLRALLQLPMPPTDDDFGCCNNDGTPMYFDPWDMFPWLYGSYSAEFDVMAITVLENIQHGRWGADHGEGLAHEMFREMLCTADLCDYGSSPMGCFPNWGSGFDVMLPELIARWRLYYALRWGEEAP